MIRSDEELEIPPCGALRTYRVIEALQQLCHNEDLLNDVNALQVFARKYSSEISRLVEQVIPSWLPMGIKQAVEENNLNKLLLDFPCSSRAQYKTKQNRFSPSDTENIRVNLEDVLRVYATLKIVSELDDLPAEMHDFAKKYYCELHGLYYFAFRSWFSSELMDEIEEEGIQSLLGDYPLGEMQTNLRKRILLWEDDPVKIAELEEFLTEQGYDVDVSKKTSELKPDSIQRIDLIILDVAMPVKSGVRLVAELKAKGVPVILLSSEPSKSGDQISLPFPKTILEKRKLVEQIQQLSGI